MPRGEAADRRASTCRGTGVRLPAARPIQDARDGAQSGAGRCPSGAIVGRVSPSTRRRQAADGRADMPDSSTILLVDDEDSVQKLLAYPLERDGFRVVQASDGEEALELFSREHVDLVVLDVMLPKLDGLEVCRRLRASSNVPIIMLTARDDELDKVLGLELGAVYYITKPLWIR